MIKPEVEKAVEFQGGELFDALEVRTRDSGEEFVALKDGAPEWMREAVRSAHGDFGPDNHRYWMIRELASDLHDQGGDTDEIEIEPDIYNHDLLAWVSSNLQRAYYVNEAVQSGAGGGMNDFDLYRALGAGQIEEKREVLNSLSASLSERAEEVLDAFSELEDRASEVIESIKVATPEGEAREAVEDELSDIELDLPVDGDHSVAILYEFLRRHPELPDEIGGVDARALVKEGHGLLAEITDDIEPFSLEPKESRPAP